MKSVLDSQKAVKALHPDHPRIEGPLKVTGAAKYTSDIVLPGMLYAVPLGSSIASGSIDSMRTEKAEAMTGVKAVYTHYNIGPIFRVVSAKGVMGHMEETRPPLADNRITYYGQYVALAVADSFEAATAAARAVEVSYKAGPAQVAQLSPTAAAKVKSERGDADSSFASAEVRIDHVYRTPAQTHNPMELHATVAVWEGDRVTLYETSQGLVNHRLILAQALGLPLENVRVICHFLGSGFGSKLFPWTHSALVASAARKLGAPVKMVLDRSMMFHAVGHRPETLQRLRIGSRKSGVIQSLHHDYVSQGSLLDEYIEDCGRVTPFLYSTPSLKVAASLDRKNVGAPTTMRGPGAVPGEFALESAMDELATQLNIDPVAFRLKNEPAIDESRNVPFSSRHLKECLNAGMKRFGWEARTSVPGSMKQDGATLGWGMSACAWDALRFDAEVTTELFADGTARVSTCSQDIGTGTYTALARMVSELTGLPIDRISVALGDTDLPPGPTSGGSRATASLVGAVGEATRKAIAAVLETAAANNDEPFKGATADRFRLREGKVAMDDSSGPSATIAEVLSRAGIHKVTGSGKSAAIQGAGEKEKHSIHSYGAHFCEVRWQPEIARLRVQRFVSVIDAGRIINPVAAQNQIEGAVVMGIGMALFEETRYEAKKGAPLNSNLADYIMMTNADSPPIDVEFLDYPDTILNELGAKGLGEIGIVGAAAAVTAAVYHATGVRVRELPVRIEHLLRA